MLLRLSTGQGAESCGGTGRQVLVCFWGLQLTVEDMETTCRTADMKPAREAMTLGLRLLHVAISCASS